MHSNFWTFLVVIRSDESFHLPASFNLLAISLLSLLILAVVRLNKPFVNKPFLSLNIQAICLVHICPGRRAINFSTIFRAIFLASLVATGYGICVHIVYRHRAISSSGPRGQPGVNPYRDYAEIVRKSLQCHCSCCAVSVASERKL